MTTAPDIAPTIMDLVGLGGVPTTMTGDSFGGVLDGSRQEHRSLVVSSWPLYLAKGEIITAVDSRPRRVASYMPLTVTTQEHSLILDGPAEEPELYNLGRDPGERWNVWGSRIEEGTALGERALSFLERQGTPEAYLAPRRLSLQGFAPDFWRGSDSTLPNTEQNQMQNANGEAV